MLCNNFIFSLGLANSLKEIEYYTVIKGFLLGKEWWNGKKGGWKRIKRWCWAGFGCKNTKDFMIYESSFLADN